MCDHTDGPGVTGKPGIGQMKGKLEPGCYGKPLADEKTEAQRSLAILLSSFSHTLVPKSPLPQNTTWVRRPIDFLGKYLRDGC